MTTDAQRAFARDFAERVYANRKKHGDPDINHIASNIGFKETLYRSVLAECAFAEVFGLTVNSDILDYGDGGMDFRLRLFTNTEARRFRVNVKCKSVQTSWAGLRESGTHLRVPVREIHPLTIYVFAIYHEHGDKAEVLRWEWGRTLIIENNRAKYENGDGEENLIKLYDHLRGLHELLNRMRPPLGFVGYEDGHLIHYCVCGAWGSFGHGVRQLKDQLGTWRCSEHNVVTAT